MIRLGIIGCGHWGSNHIRIFGMSEKAKIEICCDTSSRRLENLTKNYRTINTTTDYREVIANNNIDAVVISTPTASHYKIVKAALKNGKHVFCEKPLAVTQEESRDLMLLARKVKRILMVGYVFLFNNGIIELKKYIKSNKLGRVHYLSFNRTNLGPIRDDVDVIYDLASHDIAISSFLLDSWPKKVCASAGYFLRSKIADIAFITLYYDDNILVHIHVSWLDPKKVRTAVCVGDKKMAVWDDLNISEPIRIFNKGVISEPFYSDYGEFHLLPREGEVISPVIGLTEPLKNQDNHFLDCLNKSEQPFTDSVFGHKVTKILEAIQLSLNNNCRVERV